ncbi:potassium-transporting ATPase subunit F [Candidatus Proelusimicrobium volucris]
MAETLLFVVVIGVFGYLIFTVFNPEKF